MVSPSHLAMRQEAEREREREDSIILSAKFFFQIPLSHFRFPKLFSPCSFRARGNWRHYCSVYLVLFSQKWIRSTLERPFLLPPPPRVLQLRNISPYLWRLPWLFIPFPFLLHGEGSGGAPETSGYSGVKGKQEREKLVINSIALEEGAGTGARQFLLVYVSWPLLRAGAPFSPLSRLSCFPLLFVLFPPQIAVIGKRGEKRDGTWLRA